MSKEYDKKLNLKQNQKLSTILKMLPDFCEDYFVGIADTTQIKTRVAYAYDLRIFFYYLLHEVATFNNRSNEKDFYIDDLDLITTKDIEHYSSFLSYYTLPHYKDPNKLIEYTNTANGKMRKLASLRSFYKYFFKMERIKKNPTVLVDLPKLKEKPIVRLDPDEVVNLLDDIEDGSKLTKKQLDYHEKSNKRDLAIISLLVGTGIRISECVGLNISDFNFNNSSFSITRKGGNRTILFLPTEVEEILLDYLENFRKNQICIDPNDTDPMFLNIQKKRMGVNGIQKMLKKYVSGSVPLKHISPHKLRSTFGTNLYRETGDIYLVADVLGHSDINTTRKHYAAIDEDRKRIAANLTKLRKD